MKHIEHLHYTVFLIQISKAFVGMTLIFYLNGLSFHDTWFPFEEPKLIIKIAVI